MESIKLWAVTLPKPISCMGKSFERTIRASDGGIVRLEYQTAQRMVLLEIESKAEMPTVVLMPVEQCSGIIPEPSQAQLESVPTPRVAPPEPVYTPPPEPPPPPPAPVITAEQADAIRKEFHAKHKGPQPQQWEIDAAAEAAQRAKRHMGISEPKEQPPMSEEARRDLRIDAANYPDDRVLQQAVKELDEQKPKPKKPRKKAKRKAKRKSK